ncbi:Phospholipase C 3 PlcC [Mycobacterium tuberculosis]|nr:Phospholipase C 3 PlcC [Mycobacterium tuberculosis]
MARYGIAPTYPGDFAADVRANRLPKVSWLPYSRGPLMVSDTFDHTSQLKLIRARFGVPVPNMTRPALSPPMPGRFTL